MAKKNRSGTRISLSMLLSSAGVAVLFALRWIFAPLQHIPTNVYFVILLGALVVFAFFLANGGNPFSAAEAAARQAEDDEYFSDKAIEQRARDAKTARLTIEADDTSTGRDHI